MEQRQTVAALCVEPDTQRVLLVLQGKPGQPPTWALPGGPLRGGETPEETVVREVKEETGLEVTVLQALETDEGEAVDEHRVPYRYQVRYFAVSPGAGSLRPQDPDGRIYRAAWVERAQLDELGFAREPERQALGRFLERQGLR